MDVKWIKLDVGLFDNDKIKIIRTMPDSDAIILTWVQLLCLAGKQNNGGSFTIAAGVPYTDEMFAAVFDRPLNTIRAALTIFEKLGMVEWVDNTLYLPTWAKHQSLEKLEEQRAKTAQRVRECRQRKKEQEVQPVGDNVECNGYVTVTALDVTPQRREEKNREDKDKEIDKNRDEAANAAQPDSTTKTSLNLTDEEMTKLRENYPDNYLDAIHRVEEWKSKTKAKPTSDWKLVMKFLSEDYQKESKNYGSFDTDSFFEAAINKAK